MILYSRWCAISIASRIKLAQVFGIAKKHPTHVDSNVIKSDGFDLIDIEKALTVEAMQNYLGCVNTDMEELFNLSVAKVEGRELEGLKLKPQPLSVLPPEEVAQFENEYKTRRTISKAIIKKKNAKNKKQK